jgi:hypothetical protein
MHAVAVQHLAMEAPTWPVRLMSTTGAAALGNSGALAVNADAAAQREIKS